jgi:hypothetical protein
MIFIEVRCDECGSVGLSRHCFYAHQMREELRAEGWRHVAEGGKDFCPKCKPRRMALYERAQKNGMPAGGRHG